MNLGRMEINKQLISNGFITSESPWMLVCMCVCNNHRWGRAPVTYAHPYITMQSEVMGNDRLMAVPSHLPEPYHACTLTFQAFERLSKCGHCFLIWWVNAASTSTQHARQASKTKYSSVVLHYA
jgi:hypothetical protein